MRPQGISQYRSRCRGPIQASGSGASASAWGPGLAVPQPPHARDARPLLAPVRPPRGLLRGEEPFAVEDLALAQQVKNGPAQPRGQGSQGAGLAVLLLPPGQPALGLLAFAEQQAGRLGEGPFEMGVADFVAAGALLLPGRFVDTADQPGVRQELANLGEPADVVDLVEQDQGQDRADAGDGTQPGVGL